MSRRRSFTIKKDYVIDSILLFLLGIFLRMFLIIHFLFLGSWRRLLICSVQGHDWKFVGGGWIDIPIPFVSSSKSFECKRCIARTDKPN